MKKISAFIIGLLISPVKTFAAWTLIPETGNLADKFRSGEFELNDIAEFGLYIIQILIQVAGMIAVILIMVGGYRYVIGSFYEEKEGGKNTLKYSIAGFAVCVLSWIIVQVLVSFLTSA